MTMKFLMAMPRGHASTRRSSAAAECWTNRGSGNGRCARTRRGLDQPAGEAGGRPLGKLGGENERGEAAAVRRRIGEAAVCRAVAAGGAMCGLRNVRVIVRVRCMRREIQRERQQQDGERSSQPAGGRSGESEHEGLGARGVGLGSEYQTAGVCILFPFWPEPQAPAHGAKIIRRWTGSSRVDCAMTSGGPWRIPALVTIMRPAP
jgi:hypothetical protein